MLIAIPLKDNVLQPQFDVSVKIFDVADIDFENKTILSRKIVDFTGEGDALTLPQLLVREGVVVVVCGMIGESLYTSLALAGVEVLAGAPSAPPAELYKALIEGAVADSCGCNSGCGCDSGCGCEDEPDDSEKGGGSCGCGSCGCH